MTVSSLGVPQEGDSKRGTGQYGPYCPYGPYGPYYTVFKYLQRRLSSKKETIRINTTYYVITYMYVHIRKLALLSIA